MPAFFLDTDRQRQRNQTAAQMIGQFYLQLNDCDYKKAIADITNLCITKVEWKGNTVHITLSRPGLLIGRRGENIDKLLEYIMKMTENKGIIIDIIEDQIIGWLIPYDAMEYADTGDY